MVECWSDVCASSPGARGGIQGSMDSTWQQYRFHKGTSLKQNKRPLWTLTKSQTGNLRRFYISADSLVKCHCHCPDYALFCENTHTHAEWRRSLDTAGKVSPGRICLWWGWRSHQGQAGANLPGSWLVASVLLPYSAASSRELWYLCWPLGECSGSLLAGQRGSSSKRQSGLG